MKGLRGLRRTLRLLRKMVSGVRIIACDMATSQTSWALVLNDGTVRVTSTGTARRPETF